MVVGDELESFKMRPTLQYISGCGCRSISRAVASDTRGPLFEFSLGKILLQRYLLLTVEKTKIKKKRPGMAQFLKKNKLCTRNLLSTVKSVN